MTQANDAPSATRRQFLKQSSAIAAGATVLGSSVPLVHAAEDNTIRLSLIGCGGRGTGAVVNALNPHPYLFWVTVGVPMILKVRQVDPIAPWLFILGFYVFLVGSKVFIALIVGRFRTFLEGKVYLYIMRGLGVVLAGFAVYLFWDALVRFGVV